MNKQTSRTNKLLIAGSLISAGVLFGACAEHTPTFSLLPDRNVFQQGEPSIIDNKLDILWVIDNSGSMAAEQDNLGDNFNAFIQDFTTKGYDFKISVTTTDAWRAPYIGDPTKARFRDGLGSNHTGVRVIVPTTPNLISTFLTNMKQGIGGSGDERAFQSFREALNSPLNAGFIRLDSFIAVIIVSDEDDFSKDSAVYVSEDYNQTPALHSIQSYVDYMDAISSSTGDKRRYSVSTIGIFDAACLAANQPHGNLAQRYQALTEATKGVKGDICSPSFASDLDAIQNRIAELSTQFFLNRLPKPETIKIEIDDASVPQSETNGWTYHADSNSIRFHGSFIPKQGAKIVIDFDPVSIL